MSWKVDTIQNNSESIGCKRYRTLLKTLLLSGSSKTHTCYDLSITLTGYIHFSHSVSQGGLYVCVIVVAWNCKLPHLIHMFPTNIYSHLCTVYKQELSQHTMSLRMQTWLATSLSTTTYYRIVAKNSITTSASSVPF